MGANLAGPNDKRSREAEAGAIGGVTVDNSSRDPHIDLRHSESPKNPLVIWSPDEATSGDARRWKVLDHVVATSGIPKNAWVTTVEPGHFRRGRSTPRSTYTRAATCGLLYKSTDYGKTGRRLSRPSTGARLRPRNQEDLVNPRFCSWAPARSGYQSTAARAGRATGRRPAQRRGARSAIHPRDHDLVSGPRPRIWIIDDITPLRSLLPKR